MKNYNIMASLPFFAASICFLAAAFTRNMVWMILGVICLLTGSWMTWRKTKRQQALIQAARKQAEASKKSVKKK